MLQVLSIVVALSLCSFTIAQSSINSVLDQADTGVKDIATLAVFNNKRICDSLLECTEATCFRSPCRPQGTHEISHLQCLAVYNNSDCPNNQNLQVSTDQSYVRLSPLASEDNYELQVSVCAQKPIDPKLQQVWRQSGKDYIGWVFFGTPEGFLYVYPGRDYVDERCNQYDPRKRPWYINSLAVLKSVYVLLDASSSMSSRIGSLSSESRLDVAQNIVSQLLSMFTNEDRIVVSTIDGQVLAPPILVSLDGIDRSDQQPEVKALNESISKLKAQSSRADFDTSLKAPVQFFNSRSDLKVLFILSDGVFASALNISALSNRFQELEDGKVVIFFYKIGYDSSSDSSLQQLRSLTNMTFETVTDAYDPLLKLRSYFDYLAWLRFVNTNQSTLWVPLYDDFVGLGNLTTTTFPAFDENRRLIGIAAVDIVARGFIRELGLSVVQEAVSRRSPPPSRLESPSLPLQSPVPNVSESCPKSKLYPVCPRKDFTTPMLKFICCGDGSGDESSFWSSGKVIGFSTAGAVVALVGGVVGVVWVCKRWKKRQAPVITFPSVEEENEPGGWIKPKRSP